MSLTPQVLLQLERLAKVHRIELPGEIPESQWPEPHKATLKQAKELGSRTFDTYAIDPKANASEPWKLEAKSQAKLLVEKATRCRRRNEASWRFACEPLVFARFSAEVAWYVNASS